MICCLISIYNYINIFINLNSYVHIISYVHIVTYVKHTEICSEYDVNILVRQYELITFEITGTQIHSRKFLSYGFSLPKHLGELEHSKKNIISRIPPKFTRYQGGEI